MERKNYKNFCLAKWKSLLELSNKVIKPRHSFLLNGKHHGDFLDLILNVHIASPIASPEVSGKVFGNKQSISQWCLVKIQSQI